MKTHNRDISPSVVIEAQDKIRLSIERFLRLDPCAFLMPLPVAGNSILVDPIEHLERDLSRSEA